MTGEPAEVPDDHDAGASPPLGLERLLTVDDLSVILGIPKATLYSWRTRKRGFGPPAIKLAGNLRYRPSDVTLWLSQFDEDYGR